MSTVEFDGPSSWSLDARETGKSTKCPRLEAVGLIALGRRGGKNIFLFYPLAMPPSTPSHGHFVPRWRPVEINDQHLRSHGKIGDCV